MPSTQSQVAQAASTLDTLRAAFQSIISFAVVVYAIGFLVVNSHYSRFGITNYQLAQTRYIGAGLSYLFIHAIIAAMLAVIVFVLGRGTGPVWVLAFLLVWGLLAAVVYVLGKSLAASFVVGVNAGLMALMGYLIWSLWAGLPHTWYHSLLSSKALSRSALSSFLIAGLIILFCASALSWGRSFWPVTSATLGGGRPTEAVFVFKGDAVPLVPMQSAYVSRQLPVLYEDADDFVVLIDLGLQGSAALRLPRSAVLSVFYAPSGPAGQKQELPALTDPALSPTPTTASNPTSTAAP